MPTICVIKERLPLSGLSVWIPAYAGAYTRGNWHNLPRPAGECLIEDEELHQTRRRLLDPVQPAIPPISVYAKPAGDGKARSGKGVKACWRLRAQLTLFRRGLAVPLVEERWLNGQNDDAIALAKTLAPRLRAPLLAIIHASQGRFADAAEALNEA